MIKKYLTIFSVAALALFSSCQKEEWPAQPNWDEIPDPEEIVDDGLLKPLPAKNNIVAHRGGSAECGFPDNSIASLRYAMQLGCYASECDIYWTKDDNVVIAHADGNCRINGLYPWEATLSEIRAAGKLKNGEEIPCLADFINEVMKDGSCTKLWLDIKNVTKPSTLTQYPINAAKRACEIINEMGANHFVEFICTGNATVMSSSFGYAFQYGLPIGWMGNQSAETFVSKGYRWANFAASLMTPQFGGTGNRNIEDYEKAGIALSVFNIDKQAGDGNAIYSDAAVEAYINNVTRFKALCTNYPDWLISKYEEATKTWDGIRSYDDWQDFIKVLKKDPTGRRFCNADGEVVLHIDLTPTGNWTPIEHFTGVFNGNGHTITLNCESTANKVGLFALMGGTVKNLTVAGSIKAGAPEGNTYIGTVAGFADYDAQIINCTNKAKIEVKAEITAGSQYVGGIAGAIEERSNIDGNVNEGEIIVDIVNAKNVNVIGGITGYAWSPIRNCKNIAAITYTDHTANKKAQYVGGIAARLWRTKGFTVEGCVNEGNLTLKTVQIANNLLGGICADAEAENVTDVTKTINILKNCVNKGIILSDSPETTIANSGKARMGGLCGSFVALESCTNEGLVKVSQGATGKSEYAVGGLCGIGGTGTWKYCKQLGDVVNNLGVNNILAHTGGMAGWVLGTLVIEDAAIDSNVSSSILYDYDQDKGTSDDLVHKNSSCVGLICGRINNTFSVTILNSKVYGTLTRTINKNGETETTDVSNFVPADNYLYGAVQSAQAIFTSNGLSCEKSR